MIIKGQKRKLPPEETEGSDGYVPTWESQREFVFSVSLSKYQRGQELPEPSLRRSVLIANTLRQINLEACRASSFNEILQPDCSTSSPLQMTDQESIFTEVNAMNYHSAVTVVNSHPGNSICPQFSSDLTQMPNDQSFQLSALNTVPNVVEVDEDWGSMSTDSDFSLSAAISSILTALESTTDGSPLSAQRTPLRSLENLSGSCHGGLAEMKQGIRACGSSWEQREEFRACESTVDVMRSSYLGDLTMEDLFQDIDTSLLERETGVLGPRNSGEGYPDDYLCYLPQFFPSSTPSFNQNLKCLPSFSSFSPLCSSFSSSSHSFPPISPFSAQGHVKEGLELEHLMEVLVES